MKYHFVLNFLFQIDLNILIYKQIHKQYCKQRAMSCVSNSNINVILQSTYLHMLLVVHYRPKKAEHTIANLCWFLLLFPLLELNVSCSCLVTETYPCFVSSVDCSTQASLSLTICHWLLELFPLSQWCSLNHLPSSVCLSSPP